MNTSNIQDLRTWEGSVEVSFNLVAPTNPLIEIFRISEQKIRTSFPSPPPPGTSRPA